MKQTFCFLLVPSFSLIYSFVRSEVLVRLLLSSTAVNTISVIHGAAELVRCGVAVLVSWFQSAVPSDLKYFVLCSYLRCRESFL
jgi:hypothetical protein